MKREPHPLDATYRIGTDIIGDGLIRQTTIDLSGEFQQRILDTKEAQVRAKLIELGWTPPNRDRGHLNGAPPAIT